VVPAVPADAEDPDRFSRAIAAIDRANAVDPNQLVLDGTAVPKELAHAQLMTAWVQRLAPDATEAAHLAARAHHFRRWTRPRSDYPEGRAGYLRWRVAAQRAHADEVGAVLADHGYDGELIERVGRIIRKEGLGSDPEVQTNEDARCLVFLTTQLEAVTDQLGQDHMVQVLRRTLPKMSAAAIRAAGELDLGERGAQLLAAAVERPPSDGPADRPPHRLTDGSSARTGELSPTLGEDDDRPERAP
jgi:hypothetical protein